MPKAVLYMLSVLCLIACLTIPALYFQGRIETGTYNSTLLAASVGWFICATALATRKKGP